MSSNSLTLALYHTDSAHNTINKALGEPLEVPITPRGEFNVKAPIIPLKMGLELQGYNYAKIGQLCYFVEALPHNLAGVYTLNLTLDLLETYKGDILQSECKYKRPPKSGEFAQLIDLGIKPEIDIIEGNETLEGSSIIFTGVN